ncbi:hypothetical protein [Microbacterium gorillae]|uniref:hypothetical protein n=1 Tax=Microbacterium gorillae TaxID=1231063 RepID=UPI00058C6D6D|nr:hypothetical protein [Microbacterium gorillae]
MSQRRPGARAIWRWIGLAAVFVLLFGTFVVLCAIGVITITLTDGTELACPPAIGVALVVGWVLLTVGFLRLSWPRSGIDVEDGAATRGTWMMFAMITGVIIGAIAGLLWLVPPMLTERLGAGALLGTGARAIPAIIMVVLLVITVVAIICGLVRILLAAKRDRP